MTLNELYLRCSYLFEENYIENSGFEAKEIIKHQLDIDETGFFLKKTDTVSDADADNVMNFVKRRINGEPIQYILGEWDFYGMTYKVGKGVLIPRPETEILCEYIINEASKLSDPIIFDLCTGSGCIGITLKNNIPGAEIYMIDKSADALKYQAQNVEMNCKNLKVNTLCEDIFNMESFDSLPMADIIVSNPPYIRSDEIRFLQSEVQLEPAMALDGGDDGLIFYRHIISEWTSHLKKSGIIAFECGEDQSDDIEAIFRYHGFDTKIIKDYNDINRFVIGRRS